jgi:hypothetical protein
LPYSPHGVKGLDDDDDDDDVGQQADKVQPGDSFSRILNIVITIWVGLLG